MNDAGSHLKHLQGNGRVKRSMYMMLGLFEMHGSIHLRVPSAEEELPHRPA